LPIKRTRILRDDPSSIDEFGSHSRIASLIRNEIIDAAEGRSIAVVGEWGSGKSTVIKLLQVELEGSDQSNHDACVFVYDAWSHQGDSLRRAFLDDLIAFFKVRNTITTQQANEATDRVWNRIETTNTTTEPLMRSHAKWLLLTLVLVPLGMKLFDIPSNDETTTWDALASVRNLIATPLILGPLLSVAIFGLINRFGPICARRALFGESHKEDTFSVLSFFVERTQGKVERKRIKSPIDSIIEFKDIFNELLDFAHLINPNLRVVITIDNIDRIPPDQARDFWSTMQTFFGDVGGIRKPQSMKYWLVAPFSIDALSFVFHDGSVAGGAADTTPASKAKAYIDKTFGTAFYIPPPILADWRKYLLKQLKEAFPEHEDADLFAVEDLFDFVKSESPAPITPRDMKLFVNDLVTLYRQRGQEISLPVMAAFWLHKDAIPTKEIGNDLLTPMERRVIDTPDWRQLFTALKYGVTPDEATQLLLQEPILSALRVADTDKLRQEENRPGFVDVLQKVVRTELDKPQKGDGTALAQMAAMIGALDRANDPAIYGLWKDLRSHLRTVTSWDEFQTSPAEGIRSILIHTPAVDRVSVCKLAARSLSNAKVAEPDGDFKAPYAPVMNWLSAAGQVIGASTEPLLLNMQLPGSPKFVLEALQQLSESNAPEAAKAAIGIRYKPEEMSTVLAGELAAGHFLRSPEVFVTFVARALKIELTWSAIISSVSQRLRIPDLNAVECRSMLMLAIASATIAKYNSGLDALKELSTQGHLSHLLNKHYGDIEVRAIVVAAILLANPTFERPGQTDQSPQGDSNFNELVNATSFDSSVIDKIGALIVASRAEVRLYQIGAQNKNLAKLVAAVVGTTVNSVEYDVDPQFLVDHRDFLEMHSDLNPPRTFISRVAKRNELLDVLAAQPFEIGRCKFYWITLDVANSTDNKTYFAFLEQGIQMQSQAEWDQALNSPSGPHFDLVELCLGLREVGRRVELPTSTRDAMLEQIRKAERGATAISDDARNRLDTIFDLLQENLRESLISDVIDDLLGLTDPPAVSRIVELFGDHIDPVKLTSADPNRVVRRIFTPIVGEPNKTTVEFILRMLDGRAAFPRRLTTATKDEFASRLRKVIEGGQPTDPLMQSLTKVARVLDIDVTPREDATPKTSEETPQA
jgi:predicted ABC-type transport system involved in lysophospholipase L1 biosynthesis ATPase subunit